MKAVKALRVVLAMTTAALANPSDPGASAVEFLEKTRAKSVNLEPGGDSALVAQTSTQKRQQIAHRLDRMARDLATGRLEVGAQQVDDDLAAVLVRKIGGFDPSEWQAFPVAMVKRGTHWLAAPVPASFENAAIGYTPSLRHRLATLEDWMLNEQARDLPCLHHQAADRLRLQIATSLPPATVRGFAAGQAAQRFLTACEQRNLPAALGLLGGLSAA